MRSEEDRTLSVLELVAALSGPAIWFAHFSAVYATQGFGCAFLEAPLGAAGARSAVKWSLAGLSLLALAAIAVVILLGHLRSARDRADANTAEHWSFLHYLRLAIAALAFAAVLWTSLAVVLMEPCARVFG